MWTLWIREIRDWPLHNTITTKSSVNTSKCGFVCVRNLRPSDWFRCVVPFHKLLLLLLIIWKKKGSALVRWQWISFWSMNFRDIYIICVCVIKMNKCVMLIDENKTNVINIQMCLLHQKSFFFLCTRDVNLLSIRTHTDTHKINWTTTEDIVWAYP